MYNIIQMSCLDKFEQNQKFNLNINESTEIDLSIFNEAVFIDGKKSVEPILKDITECKNILMDAIGKNDKSATKKNFDPKAYWKHQSFKKLEDDCRKLFGFRDTEICPYIEKYNSESGNFETKELNASVYKADRFPINGLVTDKGFYDSTHSSRFSIYISLGLIKELEPEEILAVLLHELGHCIDPALVTITYHKTNILSKYLTDRKKDLTKIEEKIIDESEKKGQGFIGILIGIGAFIVSIPIISAIKQWIDSIFHKNDLTEEEIIEKKLDRIRESVKNDKSDFNRQNFSEAFADNFARMYGYGAQLTTAIKKMDMNDYKRIKSYYEQDLDRAECITRIVEATLKDEHKTKLHRIYSLMKEYEDDIKDPNIPKEVKKNLKEDLEELKKVLDSYLNDYDDFRNRVNRIINESLQEKNAAVEQKTTEEKNNK